MSSVEITNPTRILNTTYTPGGASYVAATRYISARRSRRTGEGGRRQRKELGGGGGGILAEGTMSFRGRSVAERATLRGVLCLALVLGCCAVSDQQIQTKTTVRGLMCCSLLLCCDFGHELVNVRTTTTTTNTTKWTLYVFTLWHYISNLWGLYDRRTLLLLLLCKLPSCGAIFVVVYFWRFSFCLQYSTYSVWVRS